VDRQAGVAKLAVLAALYRAHLRGAMSISPSVDYLEGWKRTHHCADLGAANVGSERW